MSETLQGVIIGGIIASVMPLFSLFYELKKWKKEKRIELFKNEQEKLKAMYEITVDKLWEGKKDEGRFNIDLWTDMDFMMPKEVSEACHNFISEKDEKELKGKFYYLKHAMKKSLKEVDSKIEKEIGISQNNLITKIYNYIKKKIYKDNK